MPRMTYDEHEALLMQIANAGGDVGSVTEALQSLRDNYRLTDDEIRDSAEKIQSMSNDYEKLQKQNLDLFMRVTNEKTKEDEEEDIKKDDEVEELSIDDLFEERQGG